MDRCRNVYCLKTLGQTAYYCCNPHDRFCNACSVSHKCKNCLSLPKNAVSRTVCEICDTTLNLLACQCKIVCHPCTFRNPRCLKCNKFFNTITSMNPGPRKINYSNQINTDNFVTSSIPPNNYLSAEKPFAQISKKKEPETDFCAKCYSLSPLSELFCNFRCGHLLCKKQMSLNPLYCPSKGCAAEIDQESSRMFLKLCMQCQAPLPDNFEELNLCASCINRAREAEKMFQKETSQVVDIDIQKKTSLEETNKQEQDITHKFEEMTITINRPSEPLDKIVDAKNQESLFNTNISPRGNHLISLPSTNKNLLHPSRVEDDRTSSLAKSTRSRTSSITSQVQKKSRCTFCNIEVDYEFLYSFKECKKSSNKKHRGCMCCLMKTRSSRLCAGCLQDEEEQLKRKLTYTELNDMERLQLNEQNKRTKGLQFCNNCQILIPSNKLLRVNNLPTCRGCCVK